MAPDADDYALRVAGLAAGNASDALGRHDGVAFSTFDRDNDLWRSGNCAARQRAGFWWDDCGACSLNGARGPATAHFWWSSRPGHLQATRVWLHCRRI